MMLAFYAEMKQFEEITIPASRMNGYFPYKRNILLFPSI